MSVSRFQRAVVGLANVARALRGRAPLASVFQGQERDRAWSADWRRAQLLGSKRRVHPTTLPEMRAQSQHLVATNGLAAAVPQIFQEQVIGTQGILYRADVVIDGVDGQGLPVELPDTDANTACEQAFTRWVERATVDRRTSWLELEQKQVARECVDGEVVMRIVPGYRQNAFRFAVQEIDPDQLDTTLNRERGEGRTAIYMGIEVDEWDAPIRYHLLPNHPREYGPRGQRHLVVDAEDIIHEFHAARASSGQMRGEPWFAPCLDDFLNLGEWRQSYLYAARVAAAKMGFIQLDKDADDTPDLYADDDDGNGVNAPIQAEVQSGVIERLRKGETFMQFDPNFPNASYSEVESAFIRANAVCLRISYMTLSGDLSRTSFSSGRLGQLNERLVFQTLQRRRITRFCRPVHRRWLEWALLTGQIASRTRTYTIADYDRLVGSTWHPRTFPWIDPEKDIDAALKEVGANINSLTRLCAERGTDYETIVRERAREEAVRRAANVPQSLGSAASAPAASTAPRPQEDTEDDDDDESSGSSARSAAALTLLPRAAAGTS